MLRVGFNAYLLRDPNLRGWNRYTVNLLAALPAHGVRPILYSREPIHRDHLARLPADSYEVRVAPPMRYGVWENLWLPRQVRIDVFHSPFNYVDARRIRLAALMVAGDSLVADPQGFIERFDICVLIHSPDRSVKLITKWIRVLSDHRCVSYGSTHDDSK